MDIFLQQLVNGLTIGSLYALVALGYTMVYGIMKLINFAHGDLVALSAYIGLSVFSEFFGASSINLFSVLTIFILTTIIIAMIGVLLERVAYKPLRTAPRLSAVVSALGASLLIQNSIMLIWGPNMRIFPSQIFPNTTVLVSGVVFSYTQIVILVLCAVLTLSLYFFIHKTKIGTAIRASAIDKEAAALMGINVNKVISIIFILGSGLGAIGGLFIGIYYKGLTFDMGWLYGLNAFIAAIIGGIGSIPGAVLGGLLLGLFNTMISGYVSTEWSATFTFILLIVILIFRPRGILGETFIEKV